MEQLLVILTNWGRTQHLPAMMTALQAQSHKVPIVLVDNSPWPNPDSAIIEALRPQFADVWRLTVNHGPPCRFAPACLYHDYRYYLFLDDDYLVGPRLVENMLANAAALHDHFSTIGWYGRCFERDHGGYSYGYGEVRKKVCDKTGRVRTAAPVDMTVRGHLVRADLLLHALAFKWKLLEKFRAQIGVGLGRHDDFLLCQGIQFATRYPSYIAADLPGTADGTMVAHELRAADDDVVAARKRPTHRAERTQCVRCAVRMGWRSLVGGGKPR